MFELNIFCALKYVKFPEETQHWRENVKEWNVVALKNQVTVCTSFNAWKLWRICVNEPKWNKVHSDINLNAKTCSALVPEKCALCIEQLCARTSCTNINHVQNITFNAAILFFLKMLCKEVTLRGFQEAILTDAKSVEHTKMNTLLSK